MATIYTPIGVPIDPFQARIFADSIDVHDGVFDGGTFSPPHRLRPCTTFQWRKDGEIIEGEINDTYTVDTSQVANSGVYDCVITIGDENDNDPNCPLVEITTARTVAIINCGSNTFSIESTGGTLTYTVNYPSFLADVTTSDFTSDVPWLTASSVNTTDDGEGVKNSQVSVTVSSSASGRMGQASLSIGDFTCLIGVTQDFPNAVPPVTDPTPQPGPIVFRTVNSGPSALAASCTRYTITLPSGLGGSFSANYVTCNGEDAVRGFGFTSAGGSIEIAASAPPNITKFSGTGNVSDFVITEVAEGQYAAVDAQAFAGFNPAMDAELSDLTYTVTIDGVEIARNTGTPGERGTGTVIAPGVEAYYLLGDNEMIIGSEVQAQILLVSEVIGDFATDFTITHPTLGSHTLSDTLSVTDIADLRTNGVIEGDLTGTIVCNEPAVSGTFRVTAGTARIQFRASGQELGTGFFSGGFQIPIQSDLTYTVTGAGLSATQNQEVTGVIAGTDGEFSRFNTDASLQELPVGEYTWTVEFCPFGADPTFGCPCHQGAVGFVKVTGNEFF